MVAHRNSRFIVIIILQEPHPIATHLLGDENDLASTTLAKRLGNFLHVYHIYTLEYSSSIRSKITSYSSMILIDKKNYIYNMELTLNWSGNDSVCNSH